MSSFDLVKIKYVADLYTGNSIPDNEKENFKDKMYPYVSTKDIGYSTGIVNYQNGMSVDDKDGFKLAYPCDTLLCIEGGSAGKKIAFVEEKTAFVNKLCCLHPDKIESRFLYYSLQSPLFLDYFFLNMTGLIGGVNLNTLKNLFITKPPMDVQVEIANIIQNKTNKIDTLIDNQQQQIEKLKEYKQSLISDVVTKGLNPNVEFKDSGIEWIGKIPKDAQLVQLKRLAIINNGKEIVNVDGEIPVYGSGGIFKYTDDYLFQGESILYGRKGTIDKPLHVNGKFWTVDTMFYTEISELVIPRYLYYVSIGSINFDYYKSGSVLPSMTQFELGNVLLPFFDKKSQEKIIEYLDYKTSLLDKVIEQKSSKIKKLEEFKKSLIYEYVTGKRIV